jgi:hypothetical protein
VEEEQQRRPDLRQVHTKVAERLRSHLSVIGIIERQDDRRSTRRIPLKRRLHWLRDDESHLLALVKLEMIGTAVNLRPRGGFEHALEADALNAGKKVTLGT